MDIDLTSITPEFLKSCRIDKLIESFASACELYSVVLDINGHILIEPTGPSTYLGEFYVTVTDPKYYSLFQKVNNYIIASGEAMYSEIDDGNPDSRMSAAPIFIGGRFAATWILYAHSKTQNQKLFKSFDKQNMLASCLSDIITRLYAGSVTVTKEKRIRTELEFEKQCKEIVNEILGIIINGEDAKVTYMYERVGELLDIDYMVYYVFDRDNPGKMILDEYWAKGGKSDEAVETFGWEHDHYSNELAEQIREGGLIIDKKSMTNQMRVEVFEGNTRAIMVFPVIAKNEYCGRLIFIENTKERVWSKAEITFAKQVTEILSKHIEVQLKQQQIDEGWLIIKDVAEALTNYMFVRTMDGRIIYANSSLRERLGEDIIGKDSSFIVPMQDEYSEDITPMEVSKRVSVYQRYIDVLEDIYDITESFHRWKTYDKVSIVIIEPVK